MNQNIVNRYNDSAFLDNFEDLIKPTPREIQMVVDGHYREIQRYFEDYTVFYIGLFGSQNYNLDTADSDIDTKAIILPSTKDILLGKPMVSKDFKMPNGGICQVKDLRLMMKQLYNGNINFVEILYTRYWKTPTEYMYFARELRNNAGLIANRDKYNLLFMVYCMAKQKLKRMTIRTENNREKIEHFGYNPKDFFTLIRLNSFFETYYKTGSFNIAMLSAARDYNIFVWLKNGGLKAKEAGEIAIECIEDMQDKLDSYIDEYNNDELKEEHKWRNYKVEEFLENFTIDFVGYYLQMNRRDWSCNLSNIAFKNED